MKVRVRLFAGLRERAGWSEREIDASSVGEVWAALDLGDEPPGLLYAVNPLWIASGLRERWGYGSVVRVYA